MSYLVVGIEHWCLIACKSVRDPDSEAGNTPSTLTVAGLDDNEILSRASNGKERTDTTSKQNAMMTAGLISRGEYPFDFDCLFGEFKFLAWPRPKLLVFVMLTQMIVPRSSRYTSTAKQKCYLVDQAWKLAIWTCNDRPFKSNQFLHMTLEIINESQSCKRMFYEQLLTTIEDSVAEGLLGSHWDNRRSGGKLLST